MTDFVFAWWIWSMGWIQNINIFFFIPALILKIHEQLRKVKQDGAGHLNPYGR
jgi:cell division protein FtsW (lipid II flippase)